MFISFDELGTSPCNPPVWRKIEEATTSLLRRLRVDSETDMDEGSSMISLSPAQVKYKQTERSDPTFEKKSNGI